jgi:TatA/E family protein of Tat protein translocase
MVYPAGMPFGLGMWEIIVLVAVVLLIVGPAKAPGVARSLGRGVKEVRDTVTVPQQEIRDALAGEDDAAKKPRSTTPS